MSSTLKAAVPRFINQFVDTDKADSARDKLNQLVDAAWSEGWSTGQNYACQR